MTTTPPTRWVQCELCDVWRLVAAHVPDSQLADQWNCSMKHWDPHNANCQGEAEKEEDEEIHMARFQRIHQMQQSVLNQQPQQLQASLQQQQQQLQVASLVDFPVSPSPPWPQMPGEFYRTPDHQRFYTLLTRILFNNQSINEPFPAINSQPLNLYHLYVIVCQTFGCYKNVIPNGPLMGWATVAQYLQLPPTEAIQHFLQQVYNHYLCPLEGFIRSQHEQLAEQQKQKKQLANVIDAAIPRPKTAQEIFKEQKRIYNKRQIQPYNNNQPRRKVPWSADEDTALFEAIEIFGTSKWTQIIESKQFGQRLQAHTAPELRNRWKALCKEEEIANHSTVKRTQHKQHRAQFNAHPLQGADFSQHYVERDYPTTAVEMKSHNTIFDREAFDEEFRLDSDSEAQSGSYSDSDDSDDSRCRRTRSVKAKKVKPIKVKQERERPIFVDSDEDDFELKQSANESFHEFYMQNKALDVWLTEDLAIPVRHLKSYLHRIIQPHSPHILKLLQQINQLNCLNDRRDTLNKHIYQWLLNDEQQRKKLLSQIAQFTSQRQRAERRKQLEIVRAQQMQIQLQLHQQEQIRLQQQQQFQSAQTQAQQLPQQLNPYQTQASIRSQLLQQSVAAPIAATLVNQSNVPLSMATPPPTAPVTITANLQPTNQTLQTHSQAQLTTSKQVVQTQPNILQSQPTTAAAQFITMSTQPPSSAATVMTQTAQTVAMQSDTVIAEGEMQASAFATQQQSTQHTRSAVTNQHNAETHSNATDSVSVLSSIRLRRLANKQYEYVQIKFKSMLASECRRIERRVLRLKKGENNTLTILKNEECAVYEPLTAAAVHVTSQSTSRSSTRRSSMLNTEAEHTENSTKAKRTRRKSQTHQTSTQTTQQPSETIQHQSTQLLQS